MKEMKILWPLMETFSLFYIKHFAVHVSSFTKESGSEATTVTMVSPRVWDSKMVTL